MKSGVLRRKTYLHLANGVVLRLPKNTKVQVQGGVLGFNPADEVKVFKANGQFFATVFTEGPFLVTFPKGGRVPFPLSML
jgi:hypothetical protein